MTKEKRIDRERIVSILDIIILAGFVLHVFDLVISTTTFMMRIPFGVMRVIMVILMVITVIKFALMNVEKNMWISIPVAAVYMIVCFRTGYEYMAYIAIFTVGFCGVHYKKILAAYIIPATAVILSSVFAAMCGGIANYVKADGGIRSAWGSCYYTELASALFFLLVFFWIFLKNIPDVFFIIPGGLVLYVSVFIAQSRTGATLSLVFLGFIIYKILEDKYVKRDSDSFLIFRIANAVVRFAFPVLLLFMFVMLLMFRRNMPFALKYDEVSQHRLIYASQMMDQWGIKPFGSLFRVSGNGWSIFETTNYTFIDSSYLLLLIRYGLVTTLFATLVWVWMSDKVLRAGNRRMAFAMLLIAIDSVSEQHFTELNYNILLVMPFAFMDTPENNADAKLSEWLGDAATRKFRTTQFFAVTAGVAVTFYFLPMLFSFYRTIFNGYGMTDGNVVIDKILVFVISLGTLAIIAGFIWFFSKLIATDALEKAISKRYLLLTIASAIAILLGFAVSDGCVERVYQRQLSRIAEEAGVISNITAYAKGKVYADRFPEAYRKQFAGIDRSFFDGEDMARLHNATVIVDADADFESFNRSGFSYTQISDNDAIYTSDDSVIELLTKEGYEFAPFNNKEHELSLSHTASMNGLKLLDDGSIELFGKDHSLVFGPYLELHPGEYEVTFDLALPVYNETSGSATAAGSSTSSAASTEILGRIRISSYWGEDIAADIPLTPDMFDESGNLSITVPFAGNGRGYEFLIFMEDDSELSIQRIAYRRLS